MSDVMLAGAQWLPRADYEFIQARVPVLCVDALVRQAGDPGRVALIRRDTPDGPAWCLTGGRVLRDEPLETAVRRHILATLGGQLRVIPGGIRFGTVAEYFTYPGELCDPRKHAVALTYSVSCTGQLAATGEADEARWFTTAELGELTFGFGHDVITARLLGLARLPAASARELVSHGRSWPSGAG